eukprot:11564604-Alexandrium_andersonii.AAC.1
MQFQADSPAEEEQAIPPSGRLLVLLRTARHLQHLMRKHRVGVGEHWPLECEHVWAAVVRKVSRLATAGILLPDIVPHHT